MKYTTADFLRDNNILIDKTFLTYEFHKPALIMLFLRIKLRFYTFYIRKRFNKIKGNLLGGVFIVFLGVTGVLILWSYLEKDQGLRVVTLTSGSMRPGIPIRSIIVTTPSNRFKKGDIITYREIASDTGVVFNRTITHRIIEFRKSGEHVSFITKGDANENPDPSEIDPKQVMGKVVFIAPYLGYLALLVKTLPGFFIIIALPSLLIVKNEVDLIKKEVAKFSPQ